MNDLIDRSDDTQYFGAFERKTISFSISDIKKAVPRINFKKVKLNKFQNLEKILEQRKITKISLDNSFLNLDLPVRRVVKKEVSHELISVNPLRKRVEQDEEREGTVEVEKKQVEEEEEPKEQETEVAEEKKDVTFNLEAQIVQEEENIILSPAIVSLPPFKQDVISTSGEQSVFVWPPVKQKKSEKQKNKQKPKQKKRPYFITEEKQEVKTKKQEKEKTLEKTKDKVDSGIKFPWTTSTPEDQFLDDIIEGGLESELLDLPINKTVVEPVIKAKVQEKIAFKAFVPQILPDNFSENMKASNVFSQAHKEDSGIEFVRKASNMFEKYGNYLSPIRIIILGGLTATLGYLLWTYIAPDLKTLLSQKETKEKLIVRDLFKKSHVYKKDLNLKKEEIKIKQVLSPSEDEGIFKPITEQERLLLIQKAREALESRLDPFGQDSVLPQSKIDEKIKERENENKAPSDIPLLRKQVELVGVISTDNKNIALVNVYTADYTVNPLDDKATKETKLKTALSMAVPDRIEASLLDPIEDWYVKQITKSKSRSEDPTIELVQGDKKFKLRVGQKVLLPEEKKAEESE